MVLFVTIGPNRPPVPYDSPTIMRMGMYGSNQLHCPWPLVERIGRMYVEHCIARNEGKCGQLQQKIDILTAELTAGNSSLQLQVKNAQREAETLRCQVNQLQSSTQVQAAELVQLRTTKEDLERGREEQLRKLWEREAEVIAVSKERDEAAKELEQLKADLQRHQQENLQKTRTLEQKSAEIDELKQMVLQLQSQMAEQKRVESEEKLAMREQHLRDLAVERSRLNLLFDHLQIGDPSVNSSLAPSEDGNSQSTEG